MLFRTRGVAVLAAAISCMLAVVAVLPGAGLDPAADAKALTKLDDDWSKAAATRDADKVAAYYAEDAVAYPPGEAVCVGRAAAKKTWAAYFAEPSLTISWKTTRVEAAKGSDLGYTAGTYELKVNGPDGKPMKEIGKYLCVWKKDKDGNWKAIHDMWNADTK